MKEHSDIGRITEAGAKVMNDVSEDYRPELLNRLKNLRYAAKYLSASLKESNETFLVALRDVAEAQGGMQRIAKDASTNRENLYRVFSKQGNPRLTTLGAALEAMGLRITISPVENETGGKSRQSLH